MVQIVKNASLASVIGFVELSRAGQIVNNSTFEPFVIFPSVAAIYFVLCYPLSVAARTLDRRAHTGRLAHRPHRERGEGIRPAARLGRRRPPRGAPPHPGGAGPPPRPRSHPS